MPEGYYVCGFCQRSVLNPKTMDCPGCRRKLKVDTGRGDIERDVLFKLRQTKTAQVESFGDLHPPDVPV